MQTNTNKKIAAGEVERHDDREINERLVEVLKANAIRAEQPEERKQESKTSLFSEIRSLFGLAILMIATFVYSHLVDKQV